MLCLYNIALVKLTIQNENPFQVSQNDTVKESQQLCEKMRHDMAIYQILQKQYPGVFLRIRYEDLVQNLNHTLQDIYNHIDEIPPSTIYSKLIGLMYSTSDGTAYQQSRANATASLYKWVTKNSNAQIEGMTNNCKDVLLELGYPIDISTYRIMYQDKS